jgi:hypothetical protein
MMAHYDQGKPFHFICDEDIESMVDRILESSTKADQRKIACVLSSIPVNTMTGGVAGKISDIRDRIDPLYSFLKLCDSIHDFARKFTLTEIYDWCGRPELITVTDKYKRNRRIIELIEIKKEDVLLKYLTKNNKLYFPSGSINNPFYKKNVMKRYPFNKLLSVEDQLARYRRSFRQSNKVVTVEVWMQGSTYKTLQVEQICKVFSTIQTILGDKLQFIVDGSVSLARIVTTFPVIHDRALRTFRLDPDFESFKKILNTKISKGSKPEWTPILCDASLYDAGEVDTYLIEQDHEKYLDVRPTGEIYRTFDHKQIILQGARKKKGGKLQYKLLDKWVDESDKINSLSMAKQAIDLADRHDNTISTKITDALTQKRAGDWGQVENCRLRNRVFMTIDKIAAMYAIYRNVSVIYVTQDLHKSSDLHQWSFSIVKAEPKRKNK